jgi:LPPG:FO 2-phospho-L-lactate transferase
VARLAHGLALAAPGQLAVIVNTADDFDHFGLRISPDLDTVVYTLAGLANPATGWGIAGDLQAMAMPVAWRRDLVPAGDRDWRPTSRARPACAPASR